jgi:hypothetical protein
MINKAIANSKANINLKNSNISFDANLSKELLNHISKTSDKFGNGIYKIDGKGDINTHIDGNINFKEAYIHAGELTTFITSIVTLLDNVVNPKDYKNLKSGILYVKSATTKYHFDKIKNIVTFKDIYLNASNGIQIKGEGSINLTTKEIDFKFKLFFFNFISKALSIIPNLDYIIFGKDKSLGFESTLKGTLSKPKYDTSTPKDLLHAPIKILGRLWEDMKKNQKDIEKPDSQKNIIELHRKEHGNKEINIDIKRIEGFFKELVKDIKDEKDSSTTTSTK